MLKEFSESVASEVDKNFIAEPAEVKDNVLEFAPKEKPPERGSQHIYDKLSPNHEIMVILKDMKCDSYEDAELKSQELEQRKQGLLKLVNTKMKNQKETMTRGAKLLDHTFNKGRIVKELTALEKEIHLFERKMRIVRMELKDPEVKKQEIIARAA